MFQIFDNYEILNILDQRHEKLIYYKDQLINEITNAEQQTDVTDKFSRTINSIIDELNTHLIVLKDINDQDL